MLELSDRLSPRFCVPEDLGRSIEESDGCWLWTGATSSGYGVMKRVGRSMYVHRALYELLVGPIPDGLHIDHLCRTTQCCNPAHLEPVTPQENNRRRPTKTHCAQGHLFTPESTYIRPDTGTRQCATCQQERARAHHLKKKAQTTT